MLRPLLVGLCGLVSFLSTVTAFGQAGVLGGSLPTNRMLLPLGLERMWWSQATLDFNRDKVRYLTADETIVVVQATSGMTTTFEAETGRKLWAVQLGRTDQASFPIITNDQYVLAVVGMTLYGINKFNGDIVWQINLPTHPSTSPATDQNNVYIGAMDGSMYAFDLHIIKRLYNENLLPQWSNQTLKWRFKTGKEITSPAVSDGSRVSFASSDKNLYAVTADKRELVFQFETDAPIAASLGRMDNWLYLASQDQNFFCINELNGHVRWEFISGAPVRRTPRIVDHKVFLSPDRGGMFCLDADTGRQLWWRPKLTDFVASTKSFVLTTDDQKNLAVLQRGTGTPRGILPLRNFPIRFPNERTDRVFIASEGGLVCAIRERDREFPTYHMYPEKRPIVPLFADDEPAAAAPKEPAPTDPSAPNEGAAPKENPEPKEEN